MYCKEVQMYLYFNYANIEQIYFETYLGISYSVRNQSETSY